MFSYEWETYGTGIEYTYLTNHSAQNHCSSNQNAWTWHGHHTTWTVPLITTSRLYENYSIHSFNCRPVGSVGWVPVYCVGGLWFKSRPDHESVYIWHKMFSFENRLHCTYEVNSGMVQYFEIWVLHWRVIKDWNHDMLIWWRQSGFNLLYNLSTIVQIIDIF